MRSVGMQSLNSTVVHSSCIEWTLMGRILLPVSQEIWFTRCQGITATHFLVILCIHIFQALRLVYRLRSDWTFYCCNIWWFFLDQTSSGRKLYLSHFYIFFLLLLNKTPTNKTQWIFSLVFSSPAFKTFTFGIFKTTAICTTLTWCSLGKEQNGIKLRNQKRFSSLYQIFIFVKIHRMDRFKAV